MFQVYRGIFQLINFSVCYRWEVPGTLLTDQLHPPAGSVTVDGQWTTPAWPLQIVTYPFVTESCLTAQFVFHEMNAFLKILEIYTLQTKVFGGMSESSCLSVWLSYMGKSPSWTSLVYHSLRQNVYSSIYLIFSFEWIFSSEKFFS